MFHLSNSFRQNRQNGIQSNCNLPRLTNKGKFKQKKVIFWLKIRACGYFFRFFLLRNEPIVLKWTAAIRTACQKSPQSYTPQAIAPKIKKSIQNRHTPRSVYKRFLSRLAFFQILQFHAKRKNPRNPSIFEPPKCWRYK